MTATSTPDRAASPATLALFASGGFMMLSAMIFFSPFVLSPYAIQNDVYMSNLFLSPPLFLLGGIFVLTGLLIARLQGRGMSWGPGLLLTGVGAAFLALLYVLVGGQYSSVGPPANWPPYLNEPMMTIALTLGVMEFIIGGGWGILKQSHGRMHMPAGT